MRRAFRSKPGRIARTVFFAFLFLYLASQVLVGRPAAAKQSLLPTGVPARASTASDPRLSQIVSTLARRRTNVYCWSTADWQRKMTSAATAGVSTCIRAARSGRE
jgi:hypothetical protein